VTATPTTNPQVRPIPVSGGVPKEGPSIVPIVCDFTANPAYLIDFSRLYDANLLRQVLTVYADNSANSSPLALTIPDTQQRLVWPAFSCGYLPVAQSQNLKFNVASAGAFVITLEFLNFPVAASVWSANGQPQLTAGGAMLVSDAILEGAISNGVVQTAITGNIALTDASGTITLGGTAQNALGANANRKAIQLMNISTGDLWYRWTGAAAVGGTSSFKLVSGAYYESAPGLCPNQALSIIGATTGQQFSLAWA
jgi:hypothetical protein